MLGNPHSSNPDVRRRHRAASSAAATACSDFFNASPEEYVVIFTANASQALKLVGESYPFGAAAAFLLTFDNHNSVNGIREFAAAARRARPPTFRSLPPDLRVDEDALDGAARAGRRRRPQPLRLSGAVQLLRRAASAGVDRSARRPKGWDVLLDAAAFVPTNRLDLGRWKPDFVSLSFYKMFGYPTGVGALLARREALDKLHRPWFAGGTITVASVQADRHFLAPGRRPSRTARSTTRASRPSRSASTSSRRRASSAIHERVRCLTGWLLERLLGAAPRQRPAAGRLYGPAGPNAAAAR